MIYRKDIDGLRAVAVLLVVFHHFGVKQLPGGFIGVDVFFVISGFLITGIIYPMVLENTFSFKDFYIRRLRRLMPVLFTVLASSLLVFSTVLLPSDLNKFVSSLISVNLFLANVFFWKEHGGYFEGNTQEAALLHTWSLAVEEQYYLLWPIYLILGLRLFNHKYLITFTFIILILSTIFSEYATSFAIGAAYYLLPTRAFELLIGSLLAISWRDLPEPNSITTHFLSLLGFILILYAAVTLSKTDPFPGYNALYPTIGTTLLIYTNRSHKGFINRALSCAPFISIGLISYSLYLWHWPLLVLARYTTVVLNLKNQLIMLTIAFGLSFLSWRFIEKPFRKRKGKTFAIVAFQIYCLPAAVLSVFCIAIVMSNGLPQRFDKDILKMDKALNSLPNKLRQKCHSPLRFSNNKPHPDCELGETLHHRGGAFLFGDSHANHYTGFIDELAKKEQIRALDYTLDQCPPIFDLYWGTNVQKSIRCKERNDTARSFIKQHQFDFVVLAASWPTVNSTMVFQDGNRIHDRKQKMLVIKQKLALTIETIIEYGATPIILKDIPYLGDFDPKCPLRKQLYDNNLVCKTINYPNKFMDEYLEQLTKKYPSVVIVEPRIVLCSEGKCTLSLDRIPLYRDNDHLNDSGSRILALHYLELHHNPFDDRM